MDINIYKTPEELNDKLADHIINNHLNKNIALSGGSTPLNLFKALSKKLDSIDNECKFYWVDERCVPPESDDSNYKMANSFLFCSNNIKKENIFRIKGENDPENELIDYNKILKKKLKLKFFTKIKKLLLEKDDL